jgi:archaellum component FlaC
VALFIHYALRKTFDKILGMDNVKFILLSIITLAIVVLVGYWAVGTLQSGSEYKLDQEISKLKEENEELKQEVEILSEELAVFKSKYPDSASLPVENPIPTEEVNTEVSTKYKYQELINELQELINDNITMKLKSKGSRVGTVQEFLNIYNKTSNRVDNDFGQTTKTRVADFQKDQGLTADGEAGPGTFKKMIEWLKNQG